MLRLIMLYMLHPQRKRIRNCMAFDGGRPIDGTPVSTEFIHCSPPLLHLAPREVLALAASLLAPGETLALAAEVAVVFAAVYRAVAPVDFGSSPSSPEVAVIVAPSFCLIPLRRSKGGARGSTLY